MILEILKDYKLITWLANSVAKETELDNLIELYSEPITQESITKLIIKEGWQFGNDAQTLIKRGFDLAKKHYGI